MGFVVSLDLQIPSNFMSFNLGELVALFGSHCDDCVSAAIGVQHTSCKSDSYSLAGIGVWRWAGVDPSTFNIHFLSLNFLQVVCHLIIGRSWQPFGEAKKATEVFVRRVFFGGRQMCHFLA